jgi:proline iminopeptidase
MDYLQPIPEAERDNLVAAFYRRLAGEDEVARMAAARAWSLWEGRASTLLPRTSVVDHFSDPHTALSVARIESHYFMHDSFLQPDQILRDAGRLHGIPGVIVHGRYDVVCPLEQAWDLHERWPQAHLQIIADAGHSAAEPGIVDALVNATDRFGACFE